MVEVVIAHSSTDIFEPEGMGGAVRYSLSLLNYLASKGCYVLFLGVYSSVRDALGPNYKFVGISRRRYSWYPYGYLFNLFIKIPFFKISPSAVILTFRLDTMIPFVILCPRNPKVVVLDEPLSAARLKFHPLIFKMVEAAFRIVAQFALKRIDRVVTNEEAARKYLDIYPWLSGKIVVSSTSVVDTRLFKPMDRIAMRKKYRFAPNEKIILFVGRLAKIKRVDFLLRAFMLVKAKVSDTRLVIVGRGEEEMNLKKMVKGLGLTGVDFLGEIPHHRIPEIMNCADVLALSSTSEGSPTVVREAIACGLPVVSTKVGDVSSIIRNDFVGRVTEHNERKFAQALIEALSIDREMAIKESLKLSETFSPQAVLSRILELCRELTLTKKSS